MQRRPAMSQAGDGAASIRSNPRSTAPSLNLNPFRTPSISDAGRQTPPLPSQPACFSPSGASSKPYVRRRKFQSSRLKPGEYDEKPWLQVKDKRRKWERIIFWVCVAVGFLLGALVFVLAYMSVTNLEYCPVFEDDFTDINPAFWNYEIQRGGFGTGSFEWTTKDPSNIYTDAEGLHIVPTLTLQTTNISLAQMTNNYVLNLTADGTCTSTQKNDCVIRSNITSGAIINPVRSARINTKGKASIKYGRVEVVAKMPAGDWLWPAIWLLPESNVYGPWPASGEIDIAESRGNAGDSYPDGRDSTLSALHWGPIPIADAFWRTAGKYNIRRTDFSEGFHTYGLEWNENYLFTYLDSRLLQVFFFKFSESMWNFGQFSQTIVNHTTLFDPWSQTGRYNTPFDQNFYLILNVAIGGTNGFFPDQVGGKPWADASPKAPAEFWNSQSQWYPTWGNTSSKGMTVQSVKMWSQGACGSTKS